LYLGKKKEKKKRKKEEEEEEFVLVDNCMVPIGKPKLPSRTLKKKVLLLEYFLQKKPFVLFLCHHMPAFFPAFVLFCLLAKKMQKI
jgi:hypothetical protein